MPDVGRLVGQYGPVAQALLQAVKQQPGAVRELAQRANVGYSAARYTVSRLASAGVVELHGGRPAVVAVPREDEAPGPQVCPQIVDALSMVFRSVRAGSSSVERSM